MRYAAAMIVAGAFAVFALGLRHGADPDHLAAIDNVTRNAYPAEPRLSRFVGTMFAGGHAVMVLAISVLAGLAGTRLAAHGGAIETAGSWLSAAVLLALAVANVRQLRRGATAPAGLKTRLLPRALREGSSALLAVPIGLLFGFGFETSSQILAYSVAFASGSGIAGAVLVGAMFCLGMICTDTLDSLLVHRLLAHGSASRPRVMRVWLGTVTALAAGVAAYELAQLAGWRTPVGDAVVSALLVASLLGVFAYLFVRTRALRAEPAASPAG
jgi:nickel/cobalt transporter (NiCoT) family protein